MTCKHMSKVAALPCALCERLGLDQTTPTEVNHIRVGQGMSQRSSNYLTIPLCTECHRGPHGLHGDRSLFRLAKVGELDLLADTIRKLVGQ